MYPNAKLSELNAVLIAIDPVSQAVGTLTTQWIDAASFERFLALIQTGLLGTSATVDAKIQQATDASGAGAKDVTGKAIAQIVKATGDNKQALINFRTDDLDINAGFGFVRLSITVGTAASLISATLLGGVAKYLPVTQSVAVVQVI
jgi:hypothetical protein